MSVVIRGMKMPKNCTECRFAFDGRCFANWGRKSKIDVTNYCPLIELPAEHGRLIDATDLLESDLGGEFYKSVIRPVLMQAPTVIEAEGVSE